MGTGHRKVSFNRSKEIDVGILNSCSLLAGFTYCLPCFSWSPPLDFVRGFAVPHIAYRRVHHLDAKRSCS